MTIIKIEVVTNLIHDFGIDSFFNEIFILRDFFLRRIGVLECTTISDVDTVLDTVCHDNIIINFHENIPSNRLANEQILYWKKNKPRIARILLENQTIL